MGSLPPSFESDRTAIWLAIVNPILDPWVSFEFLMVLKQSISMPTCKLIPFQLLY